MSLTGQVVRIISDNENYTDWLDRDLIITEQTREGYAYDTGMYPQYLVCLRDRDTGEDCPFSLYEYEFD
jgi:hypothetical protein